MAWLGIPVTIDVMGTWTLHLLNSLTGSEAVIGKPISLVFPSWSRELDSKGSHRWLSPGVSLLLCSSLNALQWPWFSRLHCLALSCCAESSVFCKWPVHTVWPMFRMEYCFRILFKGFVLSTVSSRLCALSFCFHWTVEFLNLASCVSKSI